MSRRGRDVTVSQGFGTRLLEVLADQRMTQQALAERLRASPSFISALVRGLKVPGADFLVALHEALGVSLNWLLLGTGQMYGDEVDADLLQTALVQAQLARLATSDKHPEAVSLLRNALPEVDLPPPFPPPAGERLEVYLDRLMANNQDLPTAIAMVNESLAHASLADRQRAIGDAVEAFVRKQSVPSILRLLNTSRERGSVGGSRDNLNMHSSSRPPQIPSAAPAGAASTAKRPSKSRAAKRQRGA